MRKILLILSMLPFLTSCSMVSSYRLAGDDALNPRSNAAGSYFLAKHQVVVTISDSGIAASSEAIQDQSTQMQIGLNLSATSDDEITITYEKGLLKKITSIANDKSAEIIVAIAKAIGSYRAVETAKAATKNDVTVRFDPFDGNEAIQANRIINRHVPGSCVEVEIARGMWSAGCARTLSLNHNKSYSQETVKIESNLSALAPGIYYRRPMDHRVHLVFRGKTAALQVNKFANVAPVLRVDIDRTLFVKRQTNVEFVDGELTVVKVTKPSELLAVATLPVAVFDAYVGGVINTVSKHKEIQAARAELLKQQAIVLQEESKLLKVKSEALKSGDSVTAARFGTLPNNTSRRSAQFPDQTFSDVPLIQSCMKQTGYSARDCAGILKSN